ncbi:MAG: hypothetical protein RLZZ630_593 [Bacteroidota bacterium]
MDQADRLCRDTFFATDIPHLLIGGCLDPDVFDGNTHHRGQDFTHPVDVRLDLGLLQQQSHINIADPVSAFGDEVNHATQENRAVDIFKFRGRVGEISADVFQSCSTQQGIANGMNQGVSVGMSQSALRMRDFYTSDNQFAPLNKLMDVKADSYTNIQNGTRDYSDSSRFCPLPNSAKSKVNVKWRVFSRGLRWSVGIR